MPTLLPQMHLSLAGSVQYVKLHCFWYWFWFWYWWKHLLLVSLTKSFKKLPESPVHLSNTNLSFMSLLGGISQLLYLCEPSAYFQTQSWVMTWKCTSLLPPHPIFPKPRWANWRRAGTHFACFSNSSTLEIPSHEYCILHCNLFPVLRVSDDS